MPILDNLWELEICKKFLGVYRESLLFPLLLPPSYLEVED